MKFDPKKLNTLVVRMHGRPIGVINRLAGDRHLFAFDQDYLDDPGRPTLSLSFKGAMGGLVTATRPTGPRLPPFFSTCCPKAICGTIWQSARASNPSASFFFSLSLAPIFRAAWSSRLVTMAVMLTLMPMTIRMTRVMMPRCAFHWPACN